MTMWGGDALGNTIRENVRWQKRSADQLVGNLVHHVGVVQSSSLVLPPALDVHAGFLLKVGKVKVIPVGFRKAKKKMLLVG